MTPWPHQLYAVEEIKKAIEAGHKRILVTSPTGGGKSWIMREVLDMNYRTHLYTNRNMLREQLARGLSDAGVPHGQVAAGQPLDIYYPIQLCSVQTVHSRFTKKERKVPGADICLIDEAHNNAAGMMEVIASQYPIRIGLTATPIGLGHFYDHLIVAGDNASLRKCGALLPATVFAPDEPDSARLKTSTKTGEFTVNSVVKAIMTPTIFGRVLDHYHVYNPDQKPTLLFGPGVKESRWFAEQFVKAGVPAAHIDGEHIWFNGIEMEATPEARLSLQKASECGAIKVICNRFVLREGIDMPWIAHGILATAFGALTSYIQSVGRILRNHPSLCHVVIQDHGGNYHRHGSPNQSYEWTLDADDRKITAERQDKLREDKEQEPITCPECFGVRATGFKCPFCGFEHRHRSRRVVQEDGKLIEMRGRVYKKRPLSQKPADVKLWESCLYGTRNQGRSFRSARAKFQRASGGRDPHPSLGLVPLTAEAWSMLVGHAPMNKLSPRYKPQEQ